MLSVLWFPKLGAEGPFLGYYHYQETHPAYLVTEEFIEVELTEELLDDRGIATETVRVAGIVPFLALKAIAYDDPSKKRTSTTWCIA